MSAVEARLAALGHTLPEAPKPVAAYVPAVLHGGFVYVSGQLPIVDGALPVVGKVGHAPDQVTPERAAELAQQCALNALAAAKGVLGNLDRIERVLKVNGFVASDPAFSGQPAVINGASLFLGKVFGEAGIHARAAVGVAVLPLDSPVEVDLVFAVRED